MKPFTSPTARILFLTARSLTCYRGEGSALALEEKFAADEQGIAGFANFLDSASLPFHLVVDLNEEDFRVESVAHVRGRDRQVLLDRKLQQFYRNTDYRSARLQERETGGRRDDRVLFSALTNPDLLGPWVDILIGKRIGIKGISSVPLLMESFAGWLGLDRLPHLLLVNLEEAVLRQTYLQEGRLKFSRLLPRIVSDNPAETVPAECRHTRQYLERLKLLPHDQPLEVHVCPPEGTTAGLVPEFASSPLLPIHLHDTGMQAAELGIDPALLEGRGASFLTILKSWQEGRLTNVYAPAPVTRYHRLRRLRQGLIAGTALLLAIALFSGGLLLYEGFAMKDEKRLHELAAMKFRQRYDELQRIFPATAISAREMQATVTAAESIRRREVSLAAMMILASRAVASFPEVRVEHFAWILAARAETAGEPPPPGGEPAAVPAADNGQEGTSPGPALIPALLGNRTTGVATLDGVVATGSGYGNAQQSVNGLIAALEALGVNVIPLAMPTGAKPDATLQAKLDDSGAPAGFSLKLEYRGAP